MGAKSIKDHTGVKFNSVKEMCEHWGVSYNLFTNRIHNGWDMQKALTYEKVSTNKKMCVDHTGKVFLSMREMCKYYDKKPGLVGNRIRAGWSLEESLTVPVGTPGKHRECIDHTGKVFYSFTEMCEYYGTKPGIVNNRLRAGWSLEESLVTPVGGKKSVGKKE